MNKKLIKLLAVLLIISALFGCSNSEKALETNDVSTTVITTESTTLKNPVTRKTPYESTRSTTKENSKTTKGVKAAAKETTRISTDKKQDRTDLGKLFKAIINGFISQNENDKSNKTTSSAPNPTEDDSDKLKKSACTITIQCKVLLSHMEDLKDGHEEYVPSNGYILRNYSVKYEEGDTVYSVFKRVCRDNGIPMRAKMTGFGMYVEGINNIFEKDCGANSGWTYYVDGEFPMLSVDKYELHGGEVIEFKYVV